MDGDKPLIVRVKRKPFQSAIDALWIEIHERPVKRPLLDIAKLSISEASSSTSREEELKSKKVFVERVETVSTEETFHVVQSVLENSSALRSSKEAGKWRQSVPSKLEPILAKSRESHEALSRNARFDQIWKSRKAKSEQLGGADVNQMCQFYDIARVDNEGCEAGIQRDKKIDIEESKLLASFLPLLREADPSAALEIEHNIFNSQAHNDDDYVYDFYAVSEGADYTEDSASAFPLVQVEQDDDFWDGSDDTEYETDDSNDENHPFNDYPDEEPSEFEEASDSQSEDSEEETSEDEDDLQEVDSSSSVDQESDVTRDDPFLELSDDYNEPYYDEFDDNAMHSDDFES